MKSVALLALLIRASVAFAASEIREFDIKTIERLGNELTEVSQRADRGATDAVRKRAVQTAKAALQGKLFNVRYDYVVLADPDGSGFLVYALGKGSKRGDVVVHGHFRVTISADGNKARQIAALSHSLMIDNKDNDPSPKGYHRDVFVTSQAVGTRPVETLVYASNLMNLEFGVATTTGGHGQMWMIRKGKISKGDKLD